MWIMWWTSPVQGMNTRFLNNSAYILLVSKEKLGSIARHFKVSIQLRLAAQPVKYYQNCALKWKILGLQLKRKGLIPVEQLKIELTQWMSENDAKKLKYLIYLFVCLFAFVYLGGEGAKGKGERKS